MTHPRMHVPGTWKLVASLFAALAILAACSNPEEVVDPDPVVNSVTIEGGVESITLRPGTSRALDFDVDAEDGASGDVTWSSDDPDVASIDEFGTVDAGEVGTATITATSVDDPDVEDTIAIRVSSDGEWDIDISQGTVRLEPGETRTLLVDVDVPEGETDEVTWETSDAEVVTVEDGELTAVEAGTATVTARLVADDAYSDTVDVVVSTDETLVIEQGDLDLYPTETAELSISMNPDGPVTWSSSDTDAVTIEGADTETPTLTAVEPGTSTITVSADDGELEDSITVTVSEIIVDIEPTEVTFDEGDEFDLEHVVEAPVEQTGLEWASDDESVVTVEDGVLTGVSAGTATVTATSTFRDHVSDEVEVTVEAAEDGSGGEEPDETFTIDQEDLELYPTETAELSISMDPEASVTWTSSNPDAVTIDDANSEAPTISAVEPGESSITVSADDGELEDSITVTVSEINVDIEPTEVAVAEADDLELVVTVGAPEGQMGLEWSSDDESVVTVEDGVLTGVSAGTATVTATSTFRDHVSDEVEVTVEAEADTPPTGEFDALVTNPGDYDPYSLQSWTPEDEIEGTLRYVLANAEPGDVIGFDEGITEIELHGVDAEFLDEPGDDAGPEGNVDAHLVFRQDVTLQGPEGGITLRGISGYDPGEDEDDGAGGFTYRSRVMYVVADADVTLENVTITGGDFIYLGAGIRNDGTLTVRNSTITDNRAWTYGGGVFNHGGTLTLEDTAITGNGAYTTADELAEETYDIRGGYTISMNDTGYAGGLYVDGGTVTLSGSTVITSNTAKYTGGGISMTGGTVDGTGITISDNLADPTAMGGSGEDSGGGGVAVYGGTLNLENVTIGNNEAVTYGGGLRLMPGGSASLVDVLFEGNSAMYGDAIFHEAGADPESNLTIVGGNVSIGGEGYYPPDAGELSALRAAPNVVQELPDPTDHADWLR